MLKQTIMTLEQLEKDYDKFINTCGHYPNFSDIWEWVKVKVAPMLTDDTIYKVVKGDEANSFLAAALRHCTHEQLCELRDKLIRRTASNSEA